MGAGGPNSRVRDWFDLRTIGRAEHDIHVLSSTKRRGASSISVCIPTLNEAATIGNICGVIRRDLMGPGLVDELIVCDTGSQDATVEIAREQGARVVTIDEAPLPRSAAGKGAGMWTSLAASNGDICVWLDADVVNFHAGFVLSLVVPLLEEPSIQMTKAFYRRPHGPSLPNGGGRVTEMVARPMLNLFYPELSMIIQPLSGEYAMRRDLAASLPFLSGYAVDIGLLIDACERAGLDAIAQVDLDLRVHRNRDLLALGRMSSEVLQGMLRRLDDLGRLKTGDLTTDLIQFEDGGAAGHEVEIREFPPLRDGRP